MKLAGLSSSLAPDFASGAAASPGRVAPNAAPARFEECLATSTTAGEPAGVVVRSVTENAAWSERAAQNLSPLSESPSSVARVIRESYGRYLAARPRRFHAHA